jgi:hypothetical protein
MLGGVLGLGNRSLLNSAQGEKGLPKGTGHVIEAAFRRKSGEIGIRHAIYVR